MNKHLFSILGITIYGRIVPLVVITGVCSRTLSHWCSFCSKFCTFQTREQQTLSRSTQFAKKQKQCLKKSNMQGENLEQERREYNTSGWGKWHHLTTPPIQIQVDLYFYFNHPIVLWLRSSQKMSFHLYLDLETRNKMFTSHKFTDCLFFLNLLMCCLLHSFPYLACPGFIQPASHSLIHLHPSFLPHIYPSFLSPSFHPIHPPFLSSFPSFICPSMHSFITFFLSVPCPYSLSRFPFSFSCPLLP